MIWYFGVKSNNVSLTARNAVRQLNDIRTSIFMSTCKVASITGSLNVLTCLVKQLARSCRMETLFMEGLGCLYSAMTDRVGVWWAKRVLLRLLTHDQRIVLNTWTLSMQILCSSSSVAIFISYVTLTFPKNERMENFSPSQSISISYQE